MSMSEKQFFEEAEKLGFKRLINQRFGTELQLKKFDARKLCELAVLVMKSSVSEQRDDNKVTPAVGAVIYFPSGLVGTAYRGELREGDHGEYTLLERKLVGQRLDDCVLFTTLEPCMERTPPKVCCARRITLARIKTVYIGIQDPDKTVDGEGIRYLESQNVEVPPFPRELQEEIERVNADFLANANERKKEDHELDLPPTFLKSRANAVDYSALSEEAISGFHASAGLTEPVDSGEFSARLQRLIVLDESGVPTNNGVILFGREPRETIVDAGVLGTIQYEDGKEETRDFDGPQVLAPQQIMDWVKDKLPNPNDRSDATRQEFDKAFFRLLREGVVNAIVHRDYSVTGAKIQVLATRDFVTIKSPGMPVSPVTIEQLQSLNAPMRSRNPTLHYVFNRMGLAEERGLGLTSMKQAAEISGLPLPKFTYEAPYLVLTIYRSTDAVVTSLDEETLKELTNSQRKGWEWLSKRSAVTRGEYADAMEIADRTATTHLAQFKKLGLVEVEGSGRGRSTTYRVVAQ